MVEQSDTTEKLGQIRNRISAIRARHRLALLNDEQAIKYFATGGYADACWELVGLVEEFDQHLSDGADLAKQGSIDHLPRQWR